MSSSCFKIISCGSRDSLDNDDLESSPQSKGASDKRGWSFRKRSARHRVLSNTVILETPPSGNKGSPESAAVDFQRQPNSAIPDKTSSVQWTEEKPQFPTPVNSKLSETIAAEADDTKTDASPDESVVIILQAAIRGFLAQNELLKHKNIIKLQAAVRGHLVRRQAVGTLRCVQAIVKMQALVRARRARVLEERSIAVEKQSGNHEKDSVSTPTGKQISGSKPHDTYSSTEKLLSSKFASQLLESTPRTKTINIKCDPSKSDSAWKWLERWMAGSSTEKQLSSDTVQQEEKEIEHVELSLDTAQQEEKKIEHVELSLDTAQQEEKKIEHVERSLDTVQQDEKKIKHVEQSLDTVQQEEKKIENVELSLVTVQQEEKKIVDSQEETVVLSENNCKSSDLKPTMEAFENYENLITYDADRLDIQACRPTLPSVSRDLEHPEPHNTSERNSNEITSNSIPTQGNESDLPCKLEPNTTPAGSDSDGVQFVKRTAPEQPETEGNKFLFGSRKVSNPAFLAAQSKFEELSTAANSTKSISSTNQDTEDESYTEIVSSFTDHASRKKESGLAENFVSDSSKVQYGGSDTSRVQFSECETELSISSTLDSPDRSEVGANEFEPEGQSVKDSNGHPKSKGNLEVEAKGESTNLDSDLLHSDAVQPERYSGTTSANDGVDLVISVDLPQVEKKSNTDVCESTNLDSDLPHSDAVQLEGNFGTTGANHDGVDSAMSENLSQVEKKPNTDVFELQIEAKSEKGHQISKSSPEASPRSHVIVPEPQGTPSSEVSGKHKRMRGDKSGSNHKRKSSSAGKSTPSNPNHNSGARSSTEQLSKDHKTAKRRSSFGSPRPDHVDQEPRDSSSSNPLPSYMQPTKSARAKALLNSSPLSSPDGQDKEVYLKKRHSLPGANGRHGSPQIQRTMSEAQQVAKGNGTQSPQEKKWRR